MDPNQVWLSNAKGQQGPCFPLRLVLGRLPSSVSALTADEVDGAVVMLREHAPQGIDSGFEASPVAVDSPRPRPRTRPRTRPPLRPRPSSWFTRPCPHLAQVAVDSLRYVLERSPSECAEPLLSP